MNTSASTTLRRSCATLLLLLSGLPALADEDAGDPVRGKLQFAPCTSCHIVEATGLSLQRHRLLAEIPVIPVHADHEL